MRPSGLQIGWVWIETVWRRGRQHPKLRHPDVKGEVPSITVAGAERVTAPVGTFDAYRGRPNIAVTGGNLSARLLVVSEQELSSDRLWAESRRIDGQSGA